MPTVAHAYLSSPEVVAASALSGRLSGTGVYKASENFNGVRFSYGTGLPDSPLSQLDSAVEQLESFIDRVEASVPKDGGNNAEATTRILPGFPENIIGGLLFCDADNLDVSFLIWCMDFGLSIRFPD